MNEDEISRAMYRAAQDDDRIDVLSWQAVSGKAYLTRDMRFRVAAETQATDLILLVSGSLWLIEVKGTHAEALAEDEPKLIRLRSTLSNAEILRQIERRCKRRLPASTAVVLSVAYSAGERTPFCQAEVRHLPWNRLSSSLYEGLMQAS